MDTNGNELDFGKLEIDKLPGPLAIVMDNFYKAEKAEEKWNCMMRCFDHMLRFLWALNLNDFIFNYPRDWNRFDDQNELSSFLKRYREIIGTIFKPAHGSMLNTIVTIQKLFNAVNPPLFGAALLNVKKNAGQLPKNLRESFDNLIHNRNIKQHGPAGFYKEKVYENLLSGSREHFNRIIELFKFCESLMFIGCIQHDGSLAYINLKGVDAGDFCDVTDRIVDAAKGQMRTGQVCLYNAHTGNILSLSPFYFCGKCKKCSRIHVFQQEMFYNKDTGFEGKMLDLGRQHHPADTTFIKANNVRYFESICDYKYLLDPYTFGCYFLAKKRKLTIRILDQLGNADFHHEFIIQRISSGEQFEKFDPSNVYPDSDDHYYKKEYENKVEELEFDLGKSILFDYLDSPEYPILDEVLKFKATDATKDQPALIIPDAWYPSGRYFHIGFFTPLDFEKERTLVIDYHKPIQFFTDFDNKKVRASKSPHYLYEGRDSFKIEHFIPTENFEFKLILPSGITVVENSLQLKYRNPADLSEKDLSQLKAEVAPGEDNSQVIAYQIKRPCLKNNLILEFYFHMQDPLPDQDTLSPFMAGYHLFKSINKSTFSNWRLDKKGDEVILRALDPEKKIPNSDGFSVDSTIDHKDMDMMLYLIRNSGIPIESIKELQEFQNEMEGSENIVLSARVDGKIVGWTFCNTELSLIRILVVQEDCQHRGIGSELLRQVESLLKRRESRQIRCYLHYKLGGVVPFFYKKGFRLTAIERNTGSRERDSLKLTKDLL
jgi:N-acetylglutamate synthase-like GNAT family acetyltransferase